MRLELESMFNVGDYVLNQKTGHIGQVIGSGQQVINNVFTTTLKVLVAQAENSGQRGFVVEDLHSAWTRWPSA
jgi:hypothetical protein